jgi:hypothetical protein
MIRYQYYTPEQVAAYYRQDLPTIEEWIESGRIPVTWVSVAELAADHGKNERTIRRWKDEGKIVGRKDGGGHILELQVVKTSDLIGQVRKD